MMVGNILIPTVVVLASAELSDYDFVFFNYANYTGFEGQSWSTAFVCIIGTLMGPLTVVGYEGEATMAEETLSP